jgi:hypothetical protein
MKFICALITVNDMKRSRNFYDNKDIKDNANNCELYFEYDDLEQIER